MKRKYIIQNTGDGHSPHVLEDPENPTLKVFLCSCGGTSNPNGYCDGTHAKKVRNGCDCHYCKTQAERIANKL